MEYKKVEKLLNKKTTRNKSKIKKEKIQEEEVQKHIVESNNSNQLSEVKSIIKD